MSFILNIKLYAKVKSSLATQTTCITESDSYLLPMPLTFKGKVTTRATWILHIALLRWKFHSSLKKILLFSKGFKEKTQWTQDKKTNKCWLEQFHWSLTPTFCRGGKSTKLSCAIQLVVTYLSETSVLKRLFLLKIILFIIKSWPFCQYK